jgi:TRAP-type C4-dicarboxylate transport system substrate-binding protein
MQEWMDLVTERTGGAVTFDAFWSEALCVTAELMACGADGRADIVTGTPAFDPAAYPISSLIGVPWVTENSFAAAQAYDATVAESEAMQAEFAANNLQLLVTLPTATTVLGSNEKVEGIEWFEGRSIRGGGLTLQALEAVGANPVAIPIGELYESMDRGVVEGWFSTNFGNAVLDFNLGEVTSHITDTGTGNTLSLSFLFNKDRWDSLPAEVQDIMNESLDEVLADFESGYLIPVLDELCAAADEQGIELSIWSDEEKEKWADIIADKLYDDWASAAEAAGVEDAAGEFDRFVGHVRDIEPTTQLTTEVSYCLGAN